MILALLVCFSTAITALRHWLYPLDSSNLSI